jgi:hypothetical protein
MDTLSPTELIRAKSVRGAAVGKTARQGWEIDRTEVQRFCDDFNIKLPVKIRFTTAKTKRGGHSVRHDQELGYFHRIVLEQNRSHESANKTLLHELCHAWQSEMHGDNPANFYWDFYKPANGPRGSSYRDNHFEVHARGFADLQESFYKVVKAKDNKSA